MLPKRNDRLTTRRQRKKKMTSLIMLRKCINVSREVEVGNLWDTRAGIPVILKDVRQLVTAERQLLPKCMNFGFFTTKVYEFWLFYHQSVRILGFFMKLYEYWDVT